LYFMEWVWISKMFSWKEGWKGAKYHSQVHSI
jgi:hypothetical protein